MKKILSLLTVFFSTATISINVVSCASQSSTLNLKIYWYNVYSQRYNTFNNELYTNVYYLIATYYNSVSPNPSLFANDPKIHVTIYDNTLQQQVNNDATKISVPAITNDIFNIKIIVDANDQYFHTTTIDSTTMLNPVAVPAWNNDEFNKIFADNPTTGTAAYKDIRTYIANYINTQKTSQKYDSDLTLDNIHNDQQIGISLWSDDNFINDDDKTFTSLNGAKILIAPSMVYDQYFQEKNQVLTINYK